MAYVKPIIGMRTRLLNFTLIAINKREKDKTKCAARNLLPPRTKDFIKKEKLKANSIAYKLTLTSKVIKKL
jgi:hypothetical protein